LYRAYESYPEVQNSPQTHESYPEVYNSQQAHENYPEALPDRRYISQPEPIYEADPSPDASKRDNVAAMPVEGNGRVCGLPRRTFLIVLAILLLLAAAIIGGVVGGVTGRRHKSVRLSSGLFLHGVAYRLTKATGFSDRAEHT
jgi:hypothetical protein